MSQPEYQRHWGEFSRRLRTRLDNGHKSYGDKSFALPIEQQIDEIQQELEDVCGWGLVMWGRLQRMKEQIEKPAPIPQTPPLVCSDCGHVQTEDEREYCKDCKCGGNFRPPVVKVVHGVNCTKAIHHTRGNYMHDISDDSSYDVDGVLYCGRCHEAL